MPSSAGSDKGENNHGEMSLINTHTTPVVNQKKLLGSHNSTMKNNVANFIKDHRLGNRHNAAANGSKEDDVSTGVDSAAHPFSETTSGVNFMSSRRPSQNNRGGSHPKSQMLNLSFKKILSK